MALVSRSEILEVVARNRACIGKAGKFNLDASVIPLSTARAMVDDGVLAESEPGVFTRPSTVTPVATAPAALVAEGLRLIADDRAALTSESRPRKAEKRNVTAAPVLLKCVDHGYAVRTTRKWVARYGLPSVPCCGGNATPARAGTDDVDLVVGPPLVAANEPDCG